MSAVCCFRLRNVKRNAGDRETKGFLIRHRASAERENGTVRVGSRVQKKGGLPPVMA